MRAILTALSSGPLVRVQDARRDNDFTSLWRAPDAAEFDGVAVCRAVGAGFARYVQTDPWRPRVEITDAGVAAIVEGAA